MLAMSSLQKDAVTGLLLTVFTMGVGASLYSQTTQHGGTQWSANSRQQAEDKVVHRIDEIRASAKLAPLKRVSPSVEESELVCTAALTGRKVTDPLYASLTTYVTSDPAAETDALKTIALGTEYPDEKWPRYSVVVERNADDSTGKPLYTVGIARRVTSTKEFFAPLGCDVPFACMGKWKAQVAPECRRH
ncbi:MAG: hypothetical protein WAM71_16535 [Candidatus Korobacteraceae bacterium]